MSLLIFDTETNTATVERDEGPTATDRAWWAAEQAQEAAHGAQEAAEAAAS